MINELFFSTIFFKNFGSPLFQVMVPYNYTKYIDDLTSLVHKGIVDMSRIDDAVRRILRVKFMMGLFENSLADLSFADQLGKKVGNRWHVVYYFHILHTSFSSYIVNKPQLSWMTRLGFMLEQLSNCVFNLYRSTGNWPEKLSGNHLFS
jgi:myosin-crossreactive antigen